MDSWLMLFQSVRTDSTRMVSNGSNGAEILAQSNLSGNDFKVLMKLLSVLIMKT